MIAVIQRVSRASVTVNKSVTGSCDKGFAILLGVSKEDTENDADLLAAKISKLRIFEDDMGKMNLSINDVKGSAVVISQFTLLASYAKGNRPDYLNAAPPALANELYEHFVNTLDRLIVGKVSCGVFGAHMTCEIINEGPCTIVMDSGALKTKK